MAIDSPLGILCKVLKQLRDTANRNETALKKSEAATRATLVDPLLRALGWDIADVTMVELEKVKDDFRADYVLLAPNADTKVIVEAKALGSGLADHKTVVKLFSYAANFHCNSVFITDGRQWHHYTDINIMDTSPSRVLKINNDDLTEVAAYFVQRIDAAWHWNQVQTEDIDKHIQQFQRHVPSDDTEQHLHRLQQQVDEIATQIRGLSGSSSAPKVPVKVTVTDEYVLIDKLSYVQGKSVKGIRIHDQEVSVRSWSDVIIEVAKYVLQQQIVLPVFAAGKSKIHLLSAVPYKPGIRHHVISCKSGQVYLHINFSANDIIKNSLHMLALLPEDQRKVELLVAEK